jgi:hypothetical protein
MKTAIISMGGEDYSVQYEDKNSITIESVRNMNGREMEINEEIEMEIIDRIME